MTIFVSIYYPYLTLINPCIHMYFLNRIECLIFLGQFLNPRMTYFLGPKECIPRGPRDSVTRGIPSVREIPIHPVRCTGAGGCCWRGVRGKYYWLVLEQNRVIISTHF